MEGNPSPGVAGGDPPEERAHERRGGRLEKDPQLFPLVWACGVDAERSGERRPAPWPPAFTDLRCSRLVVELEDGRLLEDAGRAEAGGVLGVAFDLGGAAAVAGDEQAGGVAGRHQRGGVVQRPAWNHVLGLLVVRE